MRVESIPGRNSYTIESAWLEKGKPRRAKLFASAFCSARIAARSRLKRPPSTSPINCHARHHLRVLVTDGDLINRASRGFNFAAPGGTSSPEGLDQFIALINHERRNDRLYVGLFVPSPTIVWDDKELPNVPLVQINVLDGRPAPGSVKFYANLWPANLLFRSAAL